MWHRQPWLKRLPYALMSAIVLLTAPNDAQSNAAEDKPVVQGAGSTFAAPLYGAWIKALAESNPAVSVNYKATSSGDGGRQFVVGSIDFAGTDAPLSDGEVAKADGGVLQLPVTAGMIVLAYNLIGFKGDLRLPRDLYPEILAGEIKWWDDSRIVAANPGIRLPHVGISVAARLDSSGATYALTLHLAKISSAWRDTGLGVGTLVDWRDALLGHGNEGVAHLIKVSDGMIGYVEYGFAARLGLPMAILENKFGVFIAPTDAAAQATIAAAGEDVPVDLRNYLADPDGIASYPIMNLSWLLLHQRYRDPAKRTAVKQFVRWGLTEGHSLSGKLGYVPLPPALNDRALQALETIT